MGELRIGASGWIYDHWRGRFYPPELPVARWFEHYSRVFDTVEINNTFYRLPEAGTFEAWREQAPPGFLYAVKASRFLTHMKKLKDPQEPLARLFERARRLGPHFGPVLYQLPPRWKMDVERLEAFCAQLPRDTAHVIEFRDASWLDGGVYETLERHGVCLCIHDLLESHPRRITGAVTYVRFHGWGARYGGRYGREQLAEWAAWMSGCLSRGIGVFAYFNNDLEAHAIHDAQMLRELLRTG